MRKNVRWSWRASLFVPERHCSRILRERRCLTQRILSSFLFASRIEKMSTRWRIHFPAPLDRWIVFVLLPWRMVVCVRSFASHFGATHCLRVCCGLSWLSLPSSISIRLLVVARVVRFTIKSIPRFISWWFLPATLVLLLLRSENFSVFVSS
jgi:hypothetical protein